MPGPIALANECCAPECDEPVSIQVPGPAGSAGTAGTNGTNGISPSVLTTAQFLMPAEGANVNVAVTANTGIAVGGKMFVTTAGTMQVISKTGTQVVTLQNLENTASGLYTDNAAPTTAIPSGSLMMPTGAQGAAGTLSGAAGGALKNNFPNPALSQANTKGTLIVGDGTNAQELSVGADATVLHVRSAQALGQQWSALDMSGVNTSLTGTLPTTRGGTGGTLPIANGGTGQTTKAPAFHALSPTVVQGDLIRMGATTDERFAQVGTGSVVQFDGTDTVFAYLTKTNLSAALGVMPVDVIILHDVKGTTLNGGTFTSGSWQTHVLTTEVADTGGHCALAAFQATLAAGTYRFRGWTLGYKCDSHQCRVQNITAGTTAKYGSNARSAAAADDMTKSYVEGRVTIAVVSIFELQCRCQTTRASDGLGLANSFGGDEVYAAIVFEREAL